MNDAKLKELVNNLTQVMGVLGKLTVQLSMIRSDVEKQIKK